MTTIKTNDKKTIKLTAVIGDGTITYQYDDKDGTKFVDQQLETDQDVKLQISSGDGKTKLSGSWRLDGDSSWTAFSTNDATVISQDLQASSSAGADEKFHFKATAGSVTGDPILLLRTKTSR